MPNQTEIIAGKRQDLIRFLDSITRREAGGNFLFATWTIAQFSNKKKARALQNISDICERFDQINACGAESRWPHNV